MPKPRITGIRTLTETDSDFDGRLAYVNSKLCNLWFTYELRRRLEGAGVPNLTVNAFDPGLVPGSGLARDYPPALRFIWNRLLPGVARVLTLAVPTINPAPKAGAALAQLVLDPALASVSGKYFHHLRPKEPDPTTHDVGRQEKLLELCRRFSGVALDAGS